MNRREFIKTSGAAITSSMAGLSGLVNGGVQLSNEKLDIRLGDKRPNLLLLMTDQQRGDCLGCAGNPVIKTPNMDAIAADGVLFSSAYVSVPSCTPARAGLLTGLSPWHHGMLGYGRVGQNYTFKMPAMLREAGYYTFGIGKMHWYPQKTLHGFHGTLVDESGRVETPDFISDYRRWFAETAPGQDPDALGIGWNSYQAGVYPLDERLHPTYWTGTTACHFLEHYNKPEPFMLKVSFARPHSPYDPPQRYMDLYQVEQMPSPQVGDWAAKYAPLSHPSRDDIWHGDRGVQAAKVSRRGYYGSISFIDEQIGRIIRTLKKKGLYDNTLILFVSDHGDMLGDHHLWRKTYAYEGSAHVPFILKWPRNFQAAIDRGSVLANPVELRDILPTFLDAAGVTVPPALDGKSLLTLLRNKTAEWRDYIDLEHAYVYAGSPNWTGLTDGVWKYIYDARDGSEQLFNLHHDPYERFDLSTQSAYAAALALWRERMADHLSERGPAFVQNNQLAIRTSQILYSPYYSHPYPS
jgi:choline-sulfatase